MINSCYLSYVKPVYIQSCGFVNNVSVIAGSMFSTFLCIDDNSLSRASTKHICAFTIPRACLLLTRYLFLTMCPYNVVVTGFCYAILACFDRICSLCNGYITNCQNKYMNNKLCIVICLLVLSVISHVLPCVRLNFFLLVLDCIALAFCLVRFLSNKSFEKNGKDGPEINPPRGNAPETAPTLDSFQEAVQNKSYDQLKQLIDEKLEEVESLRNKCNVNGIRPLNMDINKMQFNINKVTKASEHFTNEMILGFPEVLQWFNDLKKRCREDVDSLKSSVNSCREKTKSIKEYVDTCERNNCENIENARAKVSEYIKDLTVDTATINSVLDRFLLFAEEIKACTGILANIVAQCHFIVSANKTK